MAIKNIWLSPPATSHTSAEIGGGGQQKDKPKFNVIPQSYLGVIIEQTAWRKNIVAPVIVCWW